MKTLLRCAITTGSTAMLPDDDMLLVHAKARALILLTWPRPDHSAGVMDGKGNANEAAPIVIFDPRGFELGRITLAYGCLKFGTTEVRGRCHWYVKS